MVSAWIRDNNKNDKLLHEVTILHFSSTPGCSKKVCFLDSCYIIDQKVYSRIEIVNYVILLTNILKLLDHLTSYRAVRFVHFYRY